MPRNNGPLTGVELELRDDQLIISRTDASGRINYVNPDFIEASGYSEAELLGQSHHIVRHPDMPAAVFADLWADLQAGRPWIGIIQNRCRNGDSYWFEAHISPYWEQGQIVGYLSIRRMASAQKIAAARELYARMRATPADRPGFRHGAAVPTTLGKRLRAWVAHLGLAPKIFLTLLITSLAVLMGGTLLLANHLTKTLDGEAREELRRDVALLRAAVSARVESTSIAVNDYSRTLNGRVYHALGGQRKSSHAALEALLSSEASEQLMKELPGVGSVFLKTEAGFVRRLTSVTDKSEQSIVRSQMTDDHPALLGLLAGFPYSGPAHVAGREYITSYLPILDSDGEVIGASAMGIDMSLQLDTLKAELRGMKVDETGYYYIVDVTPGHSFGHAVLHPYKENTNLIAPGDNAARQLFTTMAKQRQGEIRYFWMNAEAGETRPREKLVVFDTIEKTQWIVAGGAPLDELTALSRRIALLVILGGAGLTLTIFVIMLILLRRLILRPLTGQVIPTFQAIAAGQFDTTLDHQGSDEIARVIHGLETLRNRLAFESDRELALTRLREAARQEAESLSRARGNFLANMSHEIRTPLNAIIGLVYLLGQGKLDKREMEYVRRIDGAGKLLLGVINDVLDFTRIDAGKLELNIASFRLDDVLENLSSLMRPRIHEKNLLLEYVVAPSVPQALKGDAQRLTQILINLVGNAVKFTTQGAITIFVDAMPTDDGGIELQWRVRDTGIGMSPEQQSRLFQAFSQVDTSATRKFGGTGLGLVICKRLIEMMSGTISVESSPDVGSTFHFNVRLAAGDPLPPLPMRPGSRILVVDDNDLARTILRRLLEKGGCLVDTAESGEACLALVDDPGRPAYDCIMLDLNMPGMDGVALASRLRASDKRTTRLVAVTAENIYDSRYRMALADFDAIIEKPVTALRLAEVLHELQQAPERAPATAGESSARLAGIHVLVAEDVPTNQLIMRDLLESMGAVVAIAENGAEAIERLAAAAQATDLILMDIQMPEMDGLEATRRIRAGQVRPDIPIIALTAHAYEDERQRALAAGMSDFLTKPIDPDALITVIGRCRRQPTPAEASPAAKPATAAAGDGELVIAGIDTADGLRRMMQRKPLYVKILREFVGRFAGEPQRIVADLAAGDQVGATRRAHSLKGTAATIGARQLAELASELEQCLKRGETEIDGPLARCGSELEQVLASIEQTLGPAA